MAVDVVGKLKLSPSVITKGEKIQDDFRHVFFSSWTWKRFGNDGEQKGDSLLNVEMSPMIDMKSDVDFLHNCRALELSCLSVQN